MLEPVCLGRKLKTPGGSSGQRSTAHVGPEVDNSRCGSKGVGTEYKRQSKSLLS